MGRTIGKIIEFEILYKIFIIIFASPLLDEIYQTYVASRGIAFNRDIIGVFVSVKGILIFAVLFLIAALLVFYEFAVVIHIAADSQRGEAVMLRQVMKGSFWNLKAMGGWSVIPASVCYVLALPFCKIGWRGSMVPRVNLPWFIQGEMARSEIGIAGLLAVYAAYILIFALTIFVPVYMVLGREHILRALANNFRMLRKMRLRWKLIFAAFLLIVWNAGTYGSWITSRKLLEYKDFDLDFFKYLVHTEGFYLDVLIWLAVTLIQTLVFAVFVWLAVSAWTETEAAEKGYPVWESDWRDFFRILWRHGVSLCKRAAALSGKKRWRLLAGLILVTVCAYIGMTAFFPVPYIHRPWLIGHRGSIDGIENTMEAFEGADRYGVDFAEVDVQLTKDGVPVAVHDTNLWRLAGERVNVADLTLEELQALEIGDRNHPGQTGVIPTLEQIIAFAAGCESGMGLLIELKPSGGNAEELARAVIRLVEQYDFGQRAMFMSLYYECIYPVISAHPEWWIGYCIFGSSGEIDDSVWQYDIDFIAPEENQISYSLVMKARERALPVYVWTVYDVDKMQQYLQMGVTGIITDYPDLAAEQIQSYEEKYGTERYSWKEKGYPRTQ